MSGIMKNYDNPVRVRDSRDGMLPDQRMTRAQTPRPSVGTDRPIRPCAARMRRLAAAGLALAALGAVSLGTELRQDGYVIRPPQALSMGWMDLFRGTRAGAVGGLPGAARSLSAALVDRPGQDAATMLISLVDGSFQPTPAMRDEFSAAVVKHFSESLNLTLAMERSELVEGLSPRIEVLGMVRHGGQQRKVLVAGMSGRGRHAVVTFSVPSARWSEMWPELRASLDSFRTEGSASTEIPRGLAGAAAGALAGALIVSLAVWRRRR